MGDEDDEEGKQRGKNTFLLSFVACRVGGGGGKEIVMYCLVTTMAKAFSLSSQSDLSCPFRLYIGEAVAISDKGVDYITILALAQYVHCKKPCP